MKRNVTKLFFILCILCIVNQSQCYKILAIVYTPSYSHQIPYQPLWLELHARGHEIVLITTNPIQNINSPNFTQIDISSNYNALRAIDFVKLRFEKVDWIETLEEYLFSLCSSFEIQVFNSTEVKKLYAPDSNAKFDVVLTEFLYIPAIYAFAYRFNASLIGIYSIYFIYLIFFTIVNGLKVKNNNHVLHDRRIKFVRID